jgi:hypothetical protein
VRLAYPFDTKKSGCFFSFFWTSHVVQVATKTHNNPGAFIAQNEKPKKKKEKERKRKKRFPSSCFLLVSLYLFSPFQAQKHETEKKRKEKKNLPLAKSKTQIKRKKIEQLSSPAQKSW